MTRPWTTVDDLTATLRKRWDRGIYLQRYAAGAPWEPVVLPIRRPSPAELTNDFDAVVRWAERFRRDSHTPTGRPIFATEHRTIKSKAIGRNDVPARIRFDTFGELCSLLGVLDEVRGLDALLGETDRLSASLVPWVVAHPREALAHRAEWSKLLATVGWIERHGTRDLYLRHIDVVGVDTKFVERHQQLLGRLLAIVLPTQRVDAAAATFAGRFGFLSKPNYTRFRLLSNVSMFPKGITELRLRTDELAGLDLRVTRVFVIENEVSYLAFPERPDAIAIFGEGFGLSTLERVTWLHDKEIIYWGDIDTHGLAILNRLRATFESVTSILMDRETLLAHSEQLVTEDAPTKQLLPHLNDAEQTLYRDLVEDRFGRAVRLEQERVRFSLLRKALVPWSEPTDQGAPRALPDHGRRSVPELHGDAVAGFSP